MDPIMAAALISGAIQLGTSIYGYWSATEGQAKAQAILKAAEDQFGNISDASLQRAANEVLGPGKLETLTSDPRFQAIQQESLGQLGEIAKGGLTARDRLDLNQISADQGADANRIRQTAMQRLAERGGGGASQELMTSLAAQQEGATRRGAMDANVAANASDRAMRAILDRANLAGNVRSQDYREKEAAASAADSRDKLNWGRRYDAAKDAYGRQVDTATRKYGMAQNDANRVQGNAQQNANMVAQTGQGVGHMTENVAAVNARHPETDATAAGSGYPDVDPITGQPRRAVSGSRPVGW